LVDRPRGRKRHAGAIPLTGGLCMFVAFVLACTTQHLELHLIYSLLLPAALLMLAGVLDDLLELGPVAKLALQVVAGLVAVVFGDLRLEGLGDLLGTGEITLGAWSVPFTVFAIVGVINAVNMIDGMDGLAGMVVLMALAWMAVAAISAGATQETMLLLVLAGAVTGFLAFNFRLPWGRRASVFMGDSGSAVLGFLLAYFAVTLSQGPGRALMPISAVWVLALPILDTLGLIVRRMFRGRSPLRGARDHVHHVLFYSGLCYGDTVSALTLASALFGAIGVYGALFGVSDAVLFYGLLAIFAGHVVFAELCGRSARLRRRARSTSVETPSPDAQAVREREPVINA
jgi:UDP-GlcNAc:undecaprenyl-phosphate GlcNAc-1-phosphate transferase